MVSEMPDKIDKLSDREDEDEETEQGGEEGMELQQAREIKAQKKLTQQKDKNINLKEDEEIVMLKTENAKLLRRVETLQRRNKILENKLRTQQIQDLNFPVRRMSYIRMSEHRFSSKRNTQSNIRKRMPSSYSSNAAPVTSLTEVTDLSNKKLKPAKSFKPNEEFLAENQEDLLEFEDHSEEDPEVDALYEKGPLTKEALQSISIQKRKENDESRAGFRMLVESKEDSHVNIEKIVEGVFNLQSLTKRQIRLKWVKDPRTVLIIKKPNDSAAAASLVDICKYLESRKLNVLLEDSVQGEVSKIAQNQIKPKYVGKASLRTENIDFIVCLGGDGTILWACSLFPEGIPPIVSFKLGSLGFLTPFPVSFFRDTLKHILTRDVEITIRSRLEISVFKQDKEVNKFTCLNEVVVKHPSRMVSLDLFANEDKVTVVHADGLIVATPTGSTAYSLACGGSMLHPALPAMVVTPIAPHTLSFRPIVLADSSTLTIVVPETARTEAYLCFDGRDQDTVRLDVGDKVKISLSQFPMAAYSNNGESLDWFQNIKESFLWNIRTMQKQLGDGNEFEE